ncbi:SsgA family sporulation/cell division regulator [Streptomyces sp. NPDC051020]|uniref:SsgA family sporulation/cell division regulator n=1 Tax=Streptomyces sp. NPDC051020 TaxID=3155409 RepID=UPI00341F33EE
MRRRARGRVGCPVRCRGSGFPVLRLDVRRVLDGVPWLPVRAEFRFDAGSPMVVSVTLTPWHGTGVTWRIGRDLLYQGLYVESGEGDVQAWPMQSEEGDTAWLLLESGNNSAVFELPAPLLGSWLEATYERVSAEEEMADLDWDAFLDGLLGH